MVNYVVSNIFETNFLLTLIRMGFLRVVLSGRETNFKKN